MNTLLKTLKSQRDEAQSTAEAILSKYAEDGSRPSESDAANLSDLTARLSDLDGRITELAALELANTEHDALMGRLSGRRGDSMTPPGDGPAATLGAAFTESAQFEAWVNAGRLGAMSEFQTAFALVDSMDGTKPLAGTQQIRDAAMPGFYTPILDSFARETTGVNNVWWIEYPEDDPEAGDVAEGAAKPEATYEPKVREGVVGKWAHTLPVTEEALADVPRLQSILEGALVRGVRKKAEAQAAATLLGGTYPTANGADLTAAIRNGIATVQDKGYMPGVVYANPFDLAAIDIDMLGKTLNGAVRDVNPWGIRYIASSRVPAGTAFVADSLAAFLFIDRNVLSVAMTDSHAAEFVSNIYRLRAEARGKTVIQRANAVAKVSKSTK